jgi:hypothetical protein
MITLKMKCKNRVNWLKVLGAVLLVVSAMDVPVVQGSPVAGKPLNILFIGNSYTSVNNLPSIVEAIASSAGYAKPNVMAACPGGCTFLKHLGTSATTNLIDSGAGNGSRWDAVILQEQSQTPALAEVSQEARRGFLEGAKGLYDRIKQKNPNARVILYETWARHADCWKQKPAEVQPLGANPAEMQRRIRKYYQAAAAGMGHGTGKDIVIAPVGDVWEDNYRSLQPIRLHRGDGAHPNPGGSYLAGLVLFAAIYDYASEKAAYVMPGVSQSDAMVLKKLAANHSATGRANTTAGSEPWPFPPQVHPAN